MKWICVLILLVFMVGATAHAAIARDTVHYTPPYPPSPVIIGTMFHDDTARTLAPGSDIWPLTWPAHGYQYTTFYRARLP